MIGHNSRPARADILAADAKAGLGRVAQGEADAIAGWLGYGRALNEGWLIFPSDEQFGRWIEQSVSGNLAVTPEDHERAAAMWADANSEQFEEARAAGNARTVRGIHAKWKDIEAEREAEERRKAEEASRLAEPGPVDADEAPQVAETSDGAITMPEVNARATESAPEAPDAECAPSDPPESPEDPAIANLRREYRKLTGEAQEDDWIGLRLYLGDLKAKVTAQRCKIDQMKEQLADHTGDHAEVIRRLTKAAAHNGNEAFRADERFAAEKRKTYAMGKEIERLKQEIGQQIVEI